MNNGFGRSTRLPKKHLDGAYLLDFFRVCMLDEPSFMRHHHLDENLLPSKLEAWESLTSAGLPFSTLYMLHWRNKVDFVSFLKNRDYSIRCVELLTLLLTVCCFLRSEIPIYISTPIGSVSINAWSLLLLISHF
jgi:hypothetical protein